jgi:predicted outer membrane protein
MKSKWPFVLISSGVVLSLGTALAQSKSYPMAAQHPWPGNATSTPAPSVNLSPVAASYLFTLNTDVAANLIHHINRLEINEAETALTRLQLPVVQQLAQMLLSSNESSEQRLFALPSSSNVTFYDFQESTAEIAADSQLAQISDDNYDAAYLQVQLVTHQRELQDLQLTASASAYMDPNVVTQLNSEISLLQTHISWISTVQNGGTTSVSPSPAPSTPTTMASVSPTPSVSPSSAPSVTPSASPTT